MFAKPFFAPLVSVVAALMLVFASEAGFTLEQQRLRQDQRSRVTSIVGQYRAALEGELNATLYLTNGLVAYVEAHAQLEPDVAQAMLRTLYDQGRHVRNIALAPGNRITYLYPEKGNEKAKGIYYPDIPEQWPAVQQAIAERQSRLAGPVNLKQGGVGFIYRVPVFLAPQGKYWGLLSMVIDKESLFERVGLAPRIDDVQFALRGKDGMGAAGEFFMGDPASMTDDAVTAVVNMPGGTWQLVAEPVGGWSTGSRLGWLRAAGWALGMLLGIAIYYALAGVQRRVLTEDALRASEARFAEIFEHATVGIAIVAIDGLCLRANQTMCGYFGYDRHEILSKTWQELTHSDDLSADFEALAKLLAGESAAYQREKRFIAKGGRIFWATLGVTLVRKPDGTPDYFIAVVEDITTRKKAQIALWESEEKLRGLFELSPLGIALTDMTGRYIEFNESFRAICGYGEDELKMLDYWKLTPEKYLAEEQKQLEALERTGRYGPYEKEYIRKDGSFVPLRLNGLLIPGHDGQKYIWSIVEDITRQKQDEARMRQLNETLAQQVQEEVSKNLRNERMLLQQSRLAAMGEMIGNIAHQWRQPINALGLLLTNIKESYDYDELDKEYLHGAVKKGQQMIQKMSSTIDDFRNFFQPTTERSRFRLCETVGEVIGLVNDSFKNNNVEIIVEPCDLPCYVEGYPTEFQQVVLNALTNAKDAILERDIAGKVILKTEMTETQASLVISDNGGGIPEAIMEKIFDPYFTTKPKGTGIGLYMSKMIMEKMNGEITISNKADGAEVRLTIPQG